MTKAPEPRFTYDPKWIQLASRIENATGKVILNPRNLHITDIEEVDVQWIEDRARWNDLKRYTQQSTTRRALFGTILDIPVGLKGGVGNG